MVYLCSVRGLSSCPFSKALACSVNLLYNVLLVSPWYTDFMLSRPHVSHLFVYPAPPPVVLRQFFPFAFPLQHAGQSRFSQLSSSFGELLQRTSLSWKHPCSMILGTTNPWLCLFTSSAMFFHVDARMPLGAAGQKMGNTLVGLFPVFLLYQVLFFFSFSVRLSSAKYGS